MNHSDFGKEAVPREEKSMGDMLVYFYLNVNKCEKRKGWSKYYRDIEE